MMSWFGGIVAEAIQLSKNGSVFFCLYYRWWRAV